MIKSDGKSKHLFQEMLEKQFHLNNIDLDKDDTMPADILANILEEESLLETGFMFDWEFHDWVIENATEKDFIYEDYTYRHKEYDLYHYYNHGIEY